MRRECIDKDVECRDVTNDPSYDWKQLLRSAKREFVANIIGHGIARVVFRIIGTEVDPNYNKVDVHGRHFFEFIRKDGSAMLVHYHKNGLPDRPIYVDPLCDATQTEVPGAADTQPDALGGDAAQTALPSGGASQPAEPGGNVPLPFTAQHLARPDRRSQIISKREASNALKTFLEDHRGDANAEPEIAFCHGNQM